jgi:hypothetical protein
MAKISELWQKSKETLESKSLQQILSFTGDGKLKDGNNTSIEFRELLDQVPSNTIINYANYCLTGKFEDSGLALQDIINQIGSRLGFKVRNGLYRGKSNEIGFDGIWTSNEDHSIVVEVKTTDAYRINLDTIANYRNKLIEKQEINKSKSSILIIVGREDTGDLEAQIRGSQHAWDIRLISTDSLLNLLLLKESLNDAKTILQINELLKPKEYTRVDKLIELIFTATKDSQIDEVDDAEEDNQKELKKKDSEKAVPVSFYEDCIYVVEKKLSASLLKIGKILYANKERSIGLSCAVSKAYKQSDGEIYWYAFHPHQRDFLKEYNQSFVAYGCGDSTNIILMPTDFFFSKLDNMPTTTKQNRMYWHVKILKKGNRFSLKQSKEGTDVDVTEYKV